MSAPTPKPLRLARASRVTQNRDFVRIRQQGERLAQGCLVANWNKLPEGAAPKLGVVTSRKIGGAVQRTRARRLLRESFRLHQARNFTQPVEIITGRAQFHRREKIRGCGAGFFGHSPGAPGF